MRRIIVGAQVSLDGIMQAPGGQTEDPTNGFTLGGWAMSWFDEESGGEMMKFFEQDFDLLLGRKTYDIFASFWPYYDVNGADGAIAKRFNEIKKYVVSRSGDIDTSWVGSVLLRDIADIERLAQEDGPALVTQGSTELVHALFAADLVDSISLFIAPIVLGGGKKLFADGSVPHSYKLTSGRVCGNGVIIANYDRAGEVKTSDLQGPTTARELARRERMQREG